VSDKKILVVGAGISGATLANKIANETDNKVVIIDSRNHIAGNCYDYKKENIMVHKYSIHAFHTDDHEVWNFLSSFTKWHPYMHKVKAIVDGIDIPLPFNINSIYKVFPKTLSERLEKKLLDKYDYNSKVSILELKQTEDKDLTFLSNFIYDKVFLNYTLKHWGLTPEELDSSITARVPISISRDDRYFQNKYQAIPLSGYTAMIKNMLNHDNIEVRLETSFQEIKDIGEFEHIFYTGKIEEFFDYKFGDLPYRSIDLDFQILNQENFQSLVQVNYPNNYDFTRIGEYKHFLNDKSDKTIISYEYPCEYKKDENEPYYPIIKEDNKELYSKYLKEANKLDNITFLGRLGDYKYYDMDKAVRRALDVFEKFKQGKEIK